MTSTTKKTGDTSFLGRTEPCLLLEGQDAPFYDGCTKGLKSGLHSWQVMTYSPRINAGVSRINKSSLLL